MDRAVYLQLLRTAGISALFAQLPPLLQLSAPRLQPMRVAWPRSPCPVLGQRAAGSHRGEMPCVRGNVGSGSWRPGGSALLHSSSRSSSLQMQALRWLFMKGRQPRVQTALNTVSATDSQAVGKEEIRHVRSGLHSVLVS